MDAQTLWNVMFVALVASFPSIIWFYYFRRQMIRKQSTLARFLEWKLRPRDKIYSYLGYLVGFRGEYHVRDPHVSKVQVTYTTPPYHVFFYLPVIIAFGKREKLDILLRLRDGSRIRGEAHIADTSIRSVRLALEADLIGEYKEAEVPMAGRLYKAYYRGPSLEAAKRLLERLAAKGVRVYRVSVDGSRRAILVSIEPSSLDAVEAALEEARRASKGR